MNITIFRLQLFKSSEIFIVSQATQLRYFKPIYMGRNIFGDSKGHEVALPPPIKRSISNFFVHFSILLFRNPNPFIKSLVGRKVELIHAHFGIDAVMALPLAKRLNVPLVTTLHGMDVTRTDWDMIKSGSPNLINYVLFKKQLLKKADLFICVSEFIKKAALARGFPENKLMVHYIGIDTDGLKLREGAGEDGLIVHVGRLVEKKGTTYLLQAFAQVKQIVTNARLVIIGDGPLRASLELQAQSLGIAKDVQFLGVQPNKVVLDWVKKAAVMAVPSVTAADGDMEGFGIVNIEASAQGVPVVGFVSGGIPEAIIDGETGLLSSERDVDGLVKNITQLLMSPEMRLRMGENARRNVENNFDIKKQTAKLETIYDSLIASK
jgi:colanic acid/amylovoran biosynthesis glycosyltransferase